MGTCLITEVVRAPAEELWEEHGLRMDLTQDEFAAYVAGAPSPAVLLVRQARPLVRPLALSQLRAVWGGFRPPQSYRFVPHGVVQALMA